MGRPGGQPKAARGLDVHCGDPAEPSYEVHWIDRKVPKDFAPIRLERMPGEPALDFENRAIAGAFEKIGSKKQRLGNFDQVTKKLDKAIFPITAPANRKPTSRQIEGDIWEFGFAEGILISKMDHIGFGEIDVHFFDQYYSCTHVVPNSSPPRSLDCAAVASGLFHIPAQA
jgi:hypothetical protein